MEVETAISGDVETTGSSFEVPQGVEKQLRRLKFHTRKVVKYGFKIFLDTLIYE